MSDTPRTDESEYDGIGISNFGHQDLYYAYKFARQLERELNAANERIRRLEEDLMDAKNQYAVLVADVVLYEDRGERIKRLEEAGNNLLWNFCPEYTSDLTHEQSDALKQWNKAKEAKP